MRYIWDPEKERKNILKHGITFKTAIRVFEDPNRVDIYDVFHSMDEDRFLTIGEIAGTFMVVTVVYTERSDDIRIISARRATKAERKEYYADKNNA